MTPKVKVRFIALSAPRRLDAGGMARALCFRFEVRSTGLFALSLAALLFVAVPGAFGQTSPTWQGSGTNWSDAANWDVSYANGQLQWTGGGDATSWNDRSSPQSQWRCYFEGAEAYTLGGNAVSFLDSSGTNGGIRSASSALQTINMNLSLAQSTGNPMFILTTGSGGLTFGGSVTVTNDVGALGIGGQDTSSVITFNGTTGSISITNGNLFPRTTTTGANQRALFVSVSSNFDFFTPPFRA